MNEKSNEGDIEVGTNAEIELAQNYESIICALESLGLYLDFDGKKWAWSWGHANGKDYDTVGSALEAALAPVQQFRDWMVDLCGSSRSNSIGVAIASAIGLTIKTWETPLPSQKEVALNKIYKLEKGRKIIEDMIMFSHKNKLYEPLKNPE